MAQPIHQMVTLRALQQVLHRVAGLEVAHTQMHTQQMQVMVAQQTLGTVVKRLQAFQHAQIVRTSVDQIAQQVNGVTARRKADGVQQMPQTGIAALDISNQVKCHVCIVADGIRYQWHDCF